MSEEKQKLTEKAVRIMTAIKICTQGGASCENCTLAESDCVEQLLTKAGEVIEEFVSLFTYTKNALTKVADRVNRLVEKGEQLLCEK